MNRIVWIILGTHLKLHVIVGQREKEFRGRTTIVHTHNRRLGTQIISKMERQFKDEQSHTEKKGEY